MATSTQSSTKLRPLGRLIDKATAPLWVIGPDGRLVFLSAAVGDWLTIEPESLVGRLCIAGASITNDPLDFLAASLAAPPGFSKRGTASLLIQPGYPGSKPRKIAALDTRFVRLGTAEDAITLAVAGTFADQSIDPVVEQAAMLRQQLDSWRRHHDGIAASVALGTSRMARRVHSQIRLAGSVRSDLMLVSPPGCFAESIASSVHQSAAPGEPTAIIDGPLMDAELLDASLGALIAHLADSDKTFATAIIQDIDQTPMEAQHRLIEHTRRFGHRLRLIAIADEAATIAATDPHDSAGTEALHDSPAPIGVASGLADQLCGLTIRLFSLAERIVDLPLIATAMLDRRRASGDGTADRYSRAALDALVIYPWPDNFRELDQAVKHAIRACAGEVIGPEHLPLAIRSYRPHQGISVEHQIIDLDTVVAKFETELIRDVLERCDGNRAEAARRLSISRARLLRKLDLQDEAGS